MDKLTAATGDLSKAHTKLFSENTRSRYTVLRHVKELIRALEALPNLILPAFIRCIEMPTFSANLS